MEEARKLLRESRKLFGETKQAMGRRERQGSTSPTYLTKRDFPCRMVQPAFLRPGFDTEITAA
jgi:hypothetical protein